MRNFIALLLFVSLGSGCAYLNKRVFENVHQGDTAQHVKEVLGAPQSFGSAGPDGSVQWFYVNNEEHCEIVLQKDFVTSYGCARIVKEESQEGKRKWLRAGGALLSGMGKASSGTNDVSCLSSKYGNAVQTNCH